MRSHSRIPHPAPNLRSRYVSSTSTKGRTNCRPPYAILTAALILLAFAAPAYAQDDLYIALPAKEAAQLAARDAELDAVRAQVAALEAVITAQARHIESMEKIVALQEQEIARRSRITDLADEERDVFKARAERLAKDAGRDTLALRVQARAGAGLAVGVSVAAVFPPAIIVGPVVGALVGLIEHWLVD